MSVQSTTTSPPSPPVGANPVGATSGATSGATMGGATVGGAPVGGAPSGAPVGGAFGVAAPKGAANFPPPPVLRRSSSLAAPSTGGSGLGGEESKSNKNNKNNNNTSSSNFAAAAPAVRICIDEDIEAVAKKAEKASMQDAMASKNVGSGRGSSGTSSSSSSSSGTFSSSSAAAAFAANDFATGVGTGMRVRNAALQAVYPGPTGPKLAVMRDLDEGTPEMLPFDFLLLALTGISALWGGLKEKLFPAKAFLEHLPLLAAVPVVVLQAVADQLSATPGRFDTFEVTDVHGNTHYLSSRVFEAAATTGMIRSEHLGKGVITVDQLPAEYIIGGAMCCMTHGPNVLFFSAADRNGVGGKTDAEKERWMPLLAAAGLNAAQQKIFFKNPSAFWANGAPSMRRSGPAWETLAREFKNKVESKLVDAGDADFSVPRAVDAFLNWKQHTTMPCVGDSMSEGGRVHSSKIREMMAAYDASETQILCALASAMMDQEIPTHRVADCVLLPGGRPDKDTGLPRYTIVFGNECPDVARMQHVLAMRKYTAARLLGAIDDDSAAGGGASSKRSSTSSSSSDGGGAAKRVRFATPIQTLVNAVLESRGALIVQDFDLALFLVSIDGWKRFASKAELLAFIGREFGFTAEQVTAYMAKVQVFLEANPQLVILTANSERNVRQILEWFDCRVPFIFSVYDWRAEVAAKIQGLQLTPDEFSLLHRVLCKGKDFDKEYAAHGSPPGAFANFVGETTDLATSLANVDSKCTKAKWIQANITCPFIFVDDSPSECDSVAAIGGSNGKVLNIKRPDKVAPGAPRDISQYGQFHNHPILRETPTTNPTTLVL